MMIWAAQWHSRNKLDGDSTHLLFENSLPKLFRTRKEAREYIKTMYGYIANRPDLQAEPFGWRMPQPVKVTIEVLKKYLE